MADETQAGTDPIPTQGTAADTADGGVVDTTAPTIKSVLGAAEGDKPEKTPETAETPKTKLPETTEIESYRIETPEAMEESFKRDDAVFEKLAETLRERGMGSKDAQAFINEVWPYMWDRVVEQEAELHRQIEQEAMQHPEFGGEKYEENNAKAKLAVNTFGNDDFKELIESHPLGKKVEVLLFLKAVGETLSEDGAPVTGRQRGDGDISDPKVQAAVLYPSSAQT